jgi:hypothetical protein
MCAGPRAGARTDPAVASTISALRSGGWPKSQTSSPFTASQTDMVIRLAAHAVPLLETISAGMDSQYGLSTEGS